MENQNLIINDFELSVYPDQLVVKYYSDDEIFEVKFYERTYKGCDEDVRKVLKEDTEYNRDHENVRSIREIERHVQEVLKNQK